MAVADFDYARWQNEFKRAVRDFPRGRSWDRLLKAGCDSQGLMLGLALSCDFKGAPGYEILHELRFRVLQSAKRALRMVRRLELDRKEVVELLGAETPAGLEDGLKAAIAQLREDVNAIRVVTSPRYLRPALALMLLVAYIEEKTGTPHYLDVSRLLEAAYAAFGNESQDSIGEEALRKAVERFRRRNPSLVGPNRKFQVTGLLVRLGIDAIVLTFAAQLISRYK
jgi:hypothetical protein